MPGGVNFEQVWKFQIQCMMSHQFGPLVQAIGKRSKDDVIVSCLRLGWNDAFKHVSENAPSFKALSDSGKNEEVNKACHELVKYFEQYATKKNYTDRFHNLQAMIADPTFKTIFDGIKEVDSKKYPLCLGHIQKMFNITMKVLLCLIISADHASSLGLKVKLGEVNGNNVYLTDCGLSGTCLLSYDNFDYEFDTADCPIDHIILTCIDKKVSPPTYPISGRKKYAEIVWSKMGGAENAQNYISAQQEIEHIQSDPTKSNLYFDFENW